MGQAARNKKKVVVEPKVPHHTEAEINLIGCAFLYPEDWHLMYATLQPKDFYHAQHRHVFECMQQCQRNGEPIDPVHVWKHADPKLVSMEALTIYGDKVPGAFTQHYIRIVLEKSQLRDIWSLARNMMERIDNKVDLKTCMEYLDDKIDTIRQRNLWLAPKEDAEWMARLEWDYRTFQRTGRRRLVATKANFVEVLANHSELQGALIYDSFREDIVCLKEPPWNEQPHSRSLGRTTVGSVWLDEDYTRLQCWLEMEYGSSLSKDNLAEICLMVARRNSYHPIRDALDSARWDGTPRLDTWLQTYLGAEGNEHYLRLVGVKWLISAVARVFEPGCKADHVLILEGRQGLGKSTALRMLGTLDGVSWFSDTPIDLQNKDAYISLAGKWIIELAELDSIIRSEDSTAKAFFTSSTDRFRPPYMRKTRDFPRQCVFAGSVNGDDYLRDATGGRRYWPVPCREIDHARLKHDAMQLWAEALHRYREGEAWHPETPEEINLCLHEQSQRIQQDPWHPLVLQHLEGSTGFYATHQILKDAIGMPAERIGRKEEVRLARIMVQIPSWEAYRKSMSGGKVRGYRFVLDQKDQPGPTGPEGVGP